MVQRYDQRRFGKPRLTTDWVVNHDRVLERLPERYAYETRVPKDIQAVLSLR